MSHSQKGEWQVLFPFPVSWKKMATQAAKNTEETLVESTSVGTLRDGQPLSNDVYGSAKYRQVGSSGNNGISYGITNASTTK